LGLGHGWGRGRARDRFQPRSQFAKFGLQGVDLGADLAKLGSQQRMLLPGLVLKLFYVVLHAAGSFRVTVHQIGHHADILIERELQPRHFVRQVLDLIVEWKHVIAGEQEWRRENQ
jgi:hypothetical protein